MFENFQRFITSLVLALLYAVSVPACGGGSGGVGSPPPPPAPPTLGPNFSEIQAQVFTPTCATSGCHAGPTAPQGLRLDPVNSYANLVGISSQEVPTLLRVEPGDPDNSYLIQKLEGTAAVGAQMPFGGTPLDAGTIATIRQWISDGAIDDRVPVSTPIRVTSLTPMPGTTQATPPAQIIAEFDREPDASTINATTFLLEGSGGDATFGDGNEAPVAATSISVPVANTRSAVFDLAGTTLADDTYEVRLLGDGPSIVMDPDANALDGEFTGNLPSGDGVEGGDFVVAFVVDTAPPVGTTLAEIQLDVFSVNCALSGCHSGPTSNILPTGMDLTSADDSFANLVNVSSLQQPTLMRVNPGSPDNSYLIQKLEGTAAVGQQMPLIGGPLPQETIDRIRTWIENGAER